MSEANLQTSSNTQPLTNEISEHQARDAFEKERMILLSRYVVSFQRKMFTMMIKLQCSISWAFFFFFLFIRHIIFSSQYPSFWCFFVWLLLLFLVQCHGTPVKRCKLYGPSQYESWNSCRDVQPSWNSGKYLEERVCTEMTLSDGNLRLENKLHAMSI